MKIVIIGWYGTETIGDRAILAGLISFFNKAYEDFEITIGSLYPFLSERTINEDYEFYKELIKKEFKINIFNSKSSKALDIAINKNDLIIMGGGPLMDLDELFMVEYAFKKAKKIGVKTALLGCGIGPLFDKKYQKSVIEIVNFSDLIILRDNKSKDNLKDIYRIFNLKLHSEVIYTSYDPSVECVLKYNNYYPDSNKENYIAINFRQFPIEYNKNKDSKNIDYKLEIFVKHLSERFTENEIKLIPMHYFHVGGDDRVFLNNISLNLRKSNVFVQNSNLTLKETLDIYKNANFNIGMRFHSVVLQTIVSGKNYIFDYTEPKKGKIFGFLDDIDVNNYYEKRYISLQRNNITIDIIKNVKDKFKFDDKELENRLSTYIEKLKTISK